MPGPTASRGRAGPPSGHGFPFFTSTRTLHRTAVREYIAEGGPPFPPFGGSQNETTLAYLVVGGKVMTFLREPQVFPKFPRTPIAGPFKKGLKAEKRGVDKPEKHKNLLFFL